ncbi:hypothetical protein CTP10_R64090 (plasmid) [Cupriavidus sp. P-10]|nr:hypothetical protein [Cupriavidus sp. P-10]BDB28996.1 hypothetical protein CTP10_R64090 [Cupriavidus sp. P-10]
MKWLSRLALCSLSVRPIFPPSVLFGREFPKTAWHHRLSLSNSFPTTKGSNRARVERAVAREFVNYLNEVLDMFGLFKKKPANIHDLPFGEKSQEEIRELAQSLANQIRIIVYEDVAGSSHEHDKCTFLKIEEAAFDISSSMFDRVKIWNTVESVDRDAYHNLIAAIQNQGRNKRFASSN